MIAWILKKRTFSEKEIREIIERDLPEFHLSQPVGEMAGVLILLRNQSGRGKSKIFLKGGSLI